MVFTATLLTCAFLSTALLIVDPTKKIIALMQEDTRPLDELVGKDWDEKSDMVFYFFSLLHWPPYRVRVSAEEV